METLSFVSSGWATLVSAATIVGRAWRLNCKDRRLPPESNCKDRRLPCESDEAVAFSTVTEEVHISCLVCVFGLCSAAMVEK